MRAFASFIFLVYLTFVALAIDQAEEAAKILQMRDQERDYLGLEIALGVGVKLEVGKSYLLRAKLAKEHFWKTNPFYKVYAGTVVQNEAHGLQIPVLSLSFVCHQISLPPSWSEPWFVQDSPLEPRHHVIEFKGEVQSKWVEWNHFMETGIWLIARLKKKDEEATQPKKAVEWET